MLWLWGIAANLISSGHYYDIAVRDIMLGTGAYAMARVTEARESVVFVDQSEDYRRAA
jgi:ABC-type oligopeptide transport system substrate-binding subunit